MYERTIAYIDYYENEVRIKNIGFLKWESDGMNHKLQIKVSGLYKTDTKIIGIMDEKSRLLEDMELKEGKGEIVKEYKGNTIGKEQIGLHQISCLLLKVSSQRYGIIRWNRKKVHNDSMIEGGEVKTVSSKEEMIGIQPQLKEKEVEAETIIEEPKLATPMKEKDSIQQLDNHSSTVNKRIYEDKWEQICNIYQVVHPFKGDIDYVYIKPDDFVIFREPYQKLANNSFLIHGYYNYHHIILGKIMKSGKNVYYLGVPGVYYEREKMAAEVFGFEGFESVEEDITNGTFGYYLRRVEL